MHEPLSIDLDALTDDLNAVRKELRAEAGPDDLEHLYKMERWGRLCSIIGYATCWIPFNVISAVLMGQGNVTRWAMIAHHVLHRGYDKVPGVPDRYTSKHFAQGWRRPIDWLDWIDPEAWVQEHNFLHHYMLGEERDPDQPEFNFDFLQKWWIPVPARYMAFVFFMFTWKYLYYAPNTAMELTQIHQRRDKREVEEELNLFHPRLWMPWTESGRRVWFRSFLPYGIVRFGLMPLPFLLLGPWFYAAALANIVLAEAYANVYSFIIIVPNHAGDDLYRFDRPIDGRKEFYLRQIVGSVNFATGNDRVDFLHGWLNYQIEHHVWPDMSMLQYQKAQPRVQALCEKHGVPYLQESVFKRLGKLADIAVGKATMPYFPGIAEAPAPAPAAAE